MESTIGDNDEPVIIDDAKSENNDGLMFPPDIQRYRLIKKALGDMDEWEENVKQDQELLEWE